MTDPIIHETNRGMQTIDPETGEVKPLEVDDITKYQMLNDWTEAKRKVEEIAKPLVEHEMLLRKRCMGFFFPKAVEGTNTLPLAQGWQLKGTMKFDRKVDDAAWPAVRHELLLKGVHADALVDMKPSLNTKNYRTLATIDPDSAKIFEQALTIKPASPTLELVPPKQKAPSFLDPKSQESQ